MINEPYESGDYWNGVVADLDRMPDLPVCPTPGCTLASGPGDHAGLHMDFHGNRFADEGQ